MPSPTLFAVLALVLSALPASASKVETPLAPENSGPNPQVGLGGENVDPGAEEAQRFQRAFVQVRQQWAQQYAATNGIPPQEVLTKFYEANQLNPEEARRYLVDTLRRYAMPHIGPQPTNVRPGGVGTGTGSGVRDLLNGAIPPGIVAPPASGNTPLIPGPGLVAPPAGLATLGSQLVNLVGETGGPDGKIARAHYRLATRDNAGAVKDYQFAMENGRATPEVATGLGQAAYNLGDYRLASAASALALKMQPDNQVAFSINKLSDGRTSKVSIPSSLTGLGGDAAPQAGEGLKAATGGFADPNNSGFVGAGTPGYAGVQPQAARAPETGGLSPVQASAAATENARHALVLKDYPLAVVHASKAIEFNAENAQALNYRAIAYNRMQRYNDAVTDASASLALAPGNAAALQTRSWAFSSQGQYREGLQDAESTLASDPRNAYAYQNKAFALAGMKDRPGMLDALRLSAALDARFKGQYERALQMPEDQDLTLLFSESAPAAAAAPARPAATPKRFARMALLSGTGGLLIALGILHVVSASWREKVRMTVRRVLSSDAEAAADAAAAATPHPGASAFWTQYDLVKEIGMGGMGVVYEAKDRSLERRVAVKKMRDEIRIEPHEKQRFINEAKTVAQLRHPNIVDIYSIVEDGADVYLVFEYVEGHTLHDRLRSQGAYSFGEGLKVFRDICGAVEHAHAAKVIHRDLKPSNVMVTPEGRVKVMDFGVARQAKDALTKVSMTNTVVGTPPYMAPEQEQGTVRKESDVYALGVCFYEMLTGQLPFTGAGSGMLLNKINGKHIPPTQRVPSLPASLDAVMAKALNPDPEKRHHSAAELLADLERLA
jgi:tetratricopeptide (TPR) repeat protein